MCFGLLSFRSLFLAIPSFCSTSLSLLVLFGISQFCPEALDQDSGHGLPHPVEDARWDLLLLVIFTGSGCDFDRKTLAYGDTIPVTQDLQGPVAKLTRRLRDKQTALNVSNDCARRTTQ
ncbi:hypothetical protein PoB_005747000 [Plakobranchus ocellatus]|uniref:Secreted protein n=1 Tax=Plakobranchus ocellatus TaxID=259542 RepID=A0AAV4CGR0_9GAST|nr:hypothetical protein PoB_005747000 [Plakobranchus ocellatus]